MSKGRLDPKALEELAIQADRRAAHAREHAAIARDQARVDAARGDDRAEALHLSEAEAHEGAALVTEQTAALYRNRLRHLGGKGQP